MFDAGLSNAQRLFERWRGSFGLGSMALGFAVFFVVSIGAGVLTDFYAAPPEAEQPIVFNHRRHVEENSMECSDCHEFYAKETFSGLPSADLCSFCHAEAVGESAEEARLVALLEEGAPLDWQPLFRQPAHVFFSHRRHVTVAGLECETCHGSIAMTEAPPARVVTLTMDDCVECHEREGAAVDCTACHR